MFEIIGLFIATVVFFALATLAGLLFAAAAWFMLRRRDAPRKSLMTIAVLLPIASAAYLWLCAALLPGQTLFGDISQPLPNGYYIQALGKMPDFASISRTALPYNSDVQLSECIGTLEVDGPLVVGRYSHPFATFDPHPDEPYFIFDTRNGQHADVLTLNALQSKVGHSVRLTKVELFHSREPTYLQQQRREHIIMFAPPLFAIATFFMILLAWVRLRTGPLINRNP